LCAAKIDLLILIENLREEECWLAAGSLFFSDKILKFKKKCSSGYASFTSG
jgi:hypothetical protein